MRSLRLISCGMVAAILTAASAVAQSSSAPETADAADRFTNRDLMEHSQRDRRIWLAAFIGGAANAVALHDVEAGRCISRWYDEDDLEQLGLIERSMSAYPDNRPVEIIFALVRRECPSFIPES